MEITNDSTYLSTRFVEPLLNKIKRHYPSDHIYLSRKEDEFIMDLWENGEKNRIFIPSDIFFAKTIPLRDCIISVDETDMNYELPTGEISAGKVTSYRVIIFDDYETIIDRLRENTNEAGIVGAVIPLYNEDSCGSIKINSSNFNGALVAYAIIVIPGIDSITGKIFCPKIEFINYLKKIGDEFYAQWFISFMETWYGIQIALLHPTVKEVFKTPKISVESTNAQKQKSKRPRKAKYIRKHYLTIDKLETVSNSKEARKINRKCLSWYVIGHWRTYKNGKKIFIMPYWKGVLKDIKKNVDGDMRQREINIEWDVKEKGTMITPPLENNNLIKEKQYDF